MRVVGELFTGDRDLGSVKECWPYLESAEAAGKLSPGGWESVRVLT